MMKFFRTQKQWIYECTSCKWKVSRARTRSQADFDWLSDKRAEHQSTHKFRVQVLDEIDKYLEVFPLSDEYIGISD